MRFVDKNCEIVNENWDFGWETARCRVRKGTMWDSGRDTVRFVDACEILGAKGWDDGWETLR